MVSLSEDEFMKACLDSIATFSSVPDRLAQAVFGYLPAFLSSHWRSFNVQNSISHCKHRRKRLKLYPIIVHTESVRLVQFVVTGSRVVVSATELQSNIP